jgi:hypothetical protein
MHVAIEGAQPNSLEAAHVTDFSPDGELVDDRFPEPGDG